MYKISVMKHTVGDECSVHHVHCTLTGKVVAVCIKRGRSNAFSVGHLIVALV